MISKAVASKIWPFENIATSKDRWLACVDIGGSKIAVSLAQTGAERPVLLGRSVEPTVQGGARQALAQQVLRLIDAACAAAGVSAESVQALGVSACGPFVMRAGMVELAAPNIVNAQRGRAPGQGGKNMLSLPLEAPLRKRFAKLRVENDAIGALEAERRWGALQGLDHCAYVTWSTGIGMGLCVDGRVLRGKNGNAGHAGHSLVVDEREALCGCGNVGDVESLVGGAALQRRLGLDARILLERARSGDARALAQVDEMCRVMGRALYNLVATLDLQAISIGGSLYWNHREYLLPKLQAQLAGRLPALTQGCELRSVGLGAEVGDYAALALVL